MKIYTRGGDRGETDLLGGDRVPKSDARVEAYGTVDELNAALGLALALDEEDRLEREAVEGVQADLFAIGARLAAVDPERARARGTIPTLEASRIDDLEDWIDRSEATLPTLDAFVLPGGCPTGAQLHAARTVCRRAERAIVRLLDAEPGLGDVVVPYINRLSDLLFTLARSVNAGAGRTEGRWVPQREMRGRGAGETEAPDAPGATP